MADNPTMAISKSPVRKKKPFRRLQLFNPAHKKEVLDLFSKEVWPFALKSVGEEAGKKEEEDKEVQFDVSDDEDVKHDESDNTALSENSKDVNGKFPCGACVCVFDTVHDLRDHHKLDWHRYNVKRKLNGEKPVNETIFYEMMDDLSSIEGSDSEDDAKKDSSSGAVNKLMDRISRIVPLGRDDDERLVEKSGNLSLKASPKTYYETDGGKIFGIYKSVVEVLNIQSEVSGTEFSNVLSTPVMMTIIMVSGGHFAAAVFRDGNVILHKTFHSYTVRAKQGGSQGSQDSKSGTSHPKSAGASLRRYNEQSFAQHVHELMTSWKVQIDASPVIFYRAVGSSSNVIFGGKTPPFQRSNAKLRTIPFPTNRPTFTEVKRVQSLLTVLHIYENRDEFLQEHTISKVKPGQSPKKKKVDRAKSRSPTRRELPGVDVNAEVGSSEDDKGDHDHTLEEEYVEMDLGELKEYDDSLTAEERENSKKRRRKRKPKPDSFPKPPGLIGSILDALENHAEFYQLVNSLREDASQKPHEEFLDCLNQRVNAEESNLLHLAAEKQSLELLWALLELGCDPTVKNKLGKVPYNYATTKECRMEFRRFMGQFPDKYDYKKAQVPAPLTEDLEAEKAEKKKLLNKLKREKEKQKKLERMEKEKEQSEKDRFLKLSDREKRALAAEQRILAQCKRNAENAPVLVRCFECASDLTGKVPFEYNQNVFCTPKCLATHRKKFPSPLSV